MSPSKRKPLYASGVGHGLEPEAPASKLKVYCSSCDVHIRIYALENLESNPTYRAVGLRNHFCFNGWRRRRDGHIKYCGKDLYDNCVIEKIIDAKRDEQSRNTAIEEREKLEEFKRAAQKLRFRTPPPHPTDEEAVIQCPKCHAFVCVAELADEELGYNYRCFKSDKQDKACGMDLTSAAKNHMEWLFWAHRIDDWIPDAPKLQTLGKITKRKSGN
ncbi:hypothetical protein BKA61DRAFT_580669 [Leptodontidium sp. MPI-SDFR-AT-0119]|nr:hypothetical protein BKA61DRAFT_580669 [Leptodontidium sp. MPI-SDFR-AT-0119]